MKRRHKITVIAVILFFLALAGWLQYRKAHSEAVLHQAIFVATKDGDSMVVNLDGEETEVRLIGVNTPERGTTEGDEAYAYTKGYFTRNQVIFLEFDSDKYDKYGRTLAYVWLTDMCDTSKMEEFEQYCYNAIVLKNTQCEAVYYFPNGKYREWLETIAIMKHINQ